MPAFNILERLRWKVGLGLVIVAAGFATQAAQSAGPTSDVARSSWGKTAVESTTMEAPAGAPESTDMARSSWGKAAVAESTDAESTDVA
jgi:hypothetical protein